MLASTQFWVHASQTLHMVEFCQRQYCCQVCLCIPSIKPYTSSERFLCLVSVQGFVDSQEQDGLERRADIFPNLCHNPSTKPKRLHETVFGGRSAVGTCRCMCFLFSIIAVRCGLLPSRDSILTSMLHVTHVEWVSCAGLFFFIKKSFRVKVKVGV